MFSVINDQLHQLVLIEITSSLKTTKGGSNLSDFGPAANNSYQGQMRKRSLSDTSKSHLILNPSKAVVQLFSVLGLGIRLVAQIVPLKVKYNPVE